MSVDYRTVAGLGYLINVNEDRLQELMEAQDLDFDDYDERCDFFNAETSEDGKIRVFLTSAVDYYANEIEYILVVNDEFFEMDDVNLSVVKNLMQKWLQRYADICSTDSPFGIIRCLEIY